ncbi:MAG TPA: formyltransferase family protein [Vicinamibacterales bacterium]|nr:formyltransferase family protein [Vicinamibacterales bacterium]
MHLGGLIVISDKGRRLLTAARRELRRAGWLGFLDVIAYRLFARLRLRSAEETWKAREIERLKALYPARLDTVARVVVANPNNESARAFLNTVRPDIVIARCKFILKPDIFSLARVGAFALHPGICPEYRNAHGCFWALANRDLDRVGMTLLKIDKGIDTGPVYLQAGCGIDEVSESHIVIQYRVVTENLTRIAATLIDLFNGAHVERVQTGGRKSAVWGQPRLTEYLRWKKAARSANATGIAAVS